MRTVTKIKLESLTKEEWDAIGEKIKKPLLFRLLAEQGYNVDKMWNRSYTAKELRDRVIASIRQDKLYIKTLEKNLAKMRKENETKAQILFDFCKKELERETV